MNIDKDDVTTISIIIGFLLMIFGGGRGYEKLKASDQALSDRVQVVEKRPPMVTVVECDMRRAELEKRNKIQFDAGEKMFDEIKALIAHNDDANNARHVEAMGRYEDIMKYLMDMNKQ